MKKTIRLYRQHDMDLISLYRTDGFRFAKEVKCALRACARGEVYRIKIPHAPYKEGYVKRVAMLHITLTTEKDDDIIRLLDEIRKGYVNSFVKAVFRGCLEYIPVSAYGKKNGMRMSVDELEAADPMSESELGQRQPDERPQKDNKNVIRTAPTTQHSKKKNDQLVHHSSQNVWQAKDAAASIVKSPQAKTQEDHPWQEGHGEFRASKNTENSSFAKDSDNEVEDLLNAPLPFTDDEDVQTVTNDEAEDTQGLDELFAQMSMLAH